MHRIPIRGLVRPGRAEHSFGHNRGDPRPRTGIFGAGTGRSGREPATSRVPGSFGRCWPRITGTGPSDAPILAVQSGTRSGQSRADPPGYVPRITTLQSRQHWILGTKIRETGEFSSALLRCIHPPLGIAKSPVRGTHANTKSILPNGAKTCESPEPSPVGNLPPLLLSDHRQHPSSSLTS